METRPTPRARRRALALSLALAGSLSLAQANPPGADRLIALRFFDDNPFAQGPTLSADAHAELQAAAGKALIPRGRTSDGAFLFSVPASNDAGDLRAMINRLRATGALVYADFAAPAGMEQARVAGEPARALLVTFRATAKRDARAVLRAGVASKMRAEVRESVPIGGGAERIVLPRTLAATDAAELVAQLGRHQDVAHVEIDRRAAPASTPADPLFSLQWNLVDPLGGVNAPAAWSLTTGDPSAPVAALDTGTLPHPDLAGRVVAGHDMVSDAAFAGDGDGRDADPTDPGDFVTSAEATDPASRLFGCAQTGSTWHGTMVAGAIGAVANNGVGLAAVNWQSPLLAVRVMGKCGGALSDIADGIRWAAGLPVPGTPVNPRPARVINLSLAGSGACGPILQSAVTDALAQGAVIVAAAGNDGVDVADRWPANCSGVVSVAATSKDGSRAFFSNFGASISMSAPGGGIGGSIHVLRNAGTASVDPSGYTYGQQVGTSLAAPHVSATVSLMQAVAPALTPAEVQAALEDSARAFPFVGQDPCTLAQCGAGIVDAGAAVSRARAATGELPPDAPPVRVPPPTQPVDPPEDGAPSVPVPVPGGWTAKPPSDLDRLLK